MVTLNKIYTKAGDGGKTRLGDNSEVEKTDIRVDAYGEVDELNTCLGIALCYAREDGILAGLIKQIQNDLQIEPLSKSNLKNISLINNKSGTWRFSKNLDIFENAHAVLVLTEWDEYKHIKWENVIKKMVKPAWVFDSRSIVNIELVKKAGFHLWRLGD